MAVKRDLAVATPASIVNELPAEDHAHLIKLKSLGRIYAPHLIDPVRVGGPEVRLGDPGRQLSCVRHSIPRHAKPVEFYLFNKLARAVAIRPWAPEAGYERDTVPSS
jgi:hypothetical protein